MTRPYGRTTAATGWLALVIALGGCGVRPTGIISAGEPPQADHHHAPNTVYFLQRGKLVPVQRPGVDGDIDLPFRQLVLGPTETERRHGITSDVPADLNTTFDGNVVRILLNYKDHGFSRRAWAQVACTVASRPGWSKVPVIKAVWSHTSGEEVPDGRHRCGDFADLR
jgi:hypothetical protein